jgi:hypothetical protein
MTDHSCAMGPPLLGGWFVLLDAKSSAEQTSHAGGS